MTFKHFSEDQIAELERIFDIKRAGTIKVRDGYIKPGDMVWWRGEEGPERVNSNSSGHAHNILNYPQVYQIAEPKRKTVYED
jgi:hypothetical protein